MSETLLPCPMCGAPAQNVILSASDNTNPAPNASVPVGPTPFHVMQTPPPAAQASEPVAWVDGRMLDYQHVPTSEMEFYGSQGRQFLAHSKKFRETDVPLYAHPSPPQVQGRTPEAYAIEHAGYMATAAENFFEAVNEWDRFADSDIDEGSDLALDKNEAANNLRSAIYEFRKRAERTDWYAQHAAKGKGEG